MGAARPLHLPGKFLAQMGNVAPALVPCVRLFNGQASKYNWWDAHGARHGIRQGDGCVGLDDGLQQASAALRECESLMPFLDDLHLVLPNPGRAREAMDLVTGRVDAKGKTRVFSVAEGPELGPDVWRGDKPLAELRPFEYTQAWGADRFEMAKALLRQLPRMPDRQCAWLLLCNHELFTIPPTLRGTYAAAHDAAVWGTLQACLGEPAEDAACPA